MTYDCIKEGGLHYLSRRGPVEVSGLDSWSLKAFEHLMKEPK